jgi:uncharacterized membrane protein
MLSFRQVLWRSLRIVCLILAVDGAVAYLLALLKYSFIESIGDIMLVEVAVLFILAGLIDFRYSVGMAQIKKVLVGSRDDYSASKHKDSERRALVFVIVGLILFIILILAAAYPLR